MMNTRTEYEICGVKVSGYRIGPHLAIRDAVYTLLGRLGRQDKKRAIANGRWVLEHVPTSKIICRGWYWEDVLKVARLVSDEQQSLYLSSTDVSEIVRAMRESLPEFLAAVMAQRAAVEGSTVEGAGRAG